jgi:hypothetical protein
LGRERAVALAISARTKCQKQGQNNKA